MKIKSADLYLNELTKQYGKQHVKAVDNMNLQVNNKEFLTILGPSGSGKTTLLKLIAGFEEATEGEILLGDKDITNTKAHQRGIGMVFQNYALFPHMTVRENIAYPLKIRKVSKQERDKRVDELLELIRLRDWADKYPNQLSGGQQQRVALARAIVFNPPILLLDEPLSALDKNLRTQMQLEIKRIHEEIGITTICVTHDQTEALTMSDRICVMNEGKLEQLATPNDLYNKPKNKFIAEFIGEINLIKGKYNDEHKEFITSAGEVVLKAPESKGANGKSYLGIRPENLRINGNGLSSENRVTGKVLEKIFLGDYTLLKIDTNIEDIITIKTSIAETEKIQEDDLITIGWEIKDSIIIQ